MTVLSLAAALALGYSCPDLPAVLTPLAVGFALHEGRGKLNTTAIGHNLNGTTDYGLMQINTVNLPWLHLTPDTVMDPCTNLAAGLKVFFAKYNGNPPDEVKAAYANGVMTQIAGLPASPSPRPTLGAVEEDDDLNDRPALLATERSP